MDWVSTTQKAGGCEGQVYCLRTLEHDERPVRVHIQWPDGLEADFYQGNSCDDAIHACEAHNDTLRAMK